jgi:hypothetical protein
VRIGQWSYTHVGGALLVGAGVLTLVADPISGVVLILLGLSLLLAETRPPQPEPSSTRFVPWTWRNIIAFGSLMIATLIVVLDILF